MDNQTENLKEELKSAYLDWAEKVVTNKLKDLPSVKTPDIDTLIKDLESLEKEIYELKNTKEVKISIRAGVPEIVQKSKGVKVTIVDWDCAEYEDYNNPNSKLIPSSFVCPAEEEIIP